MAFDLEMACHNAQARLARHVGQLVGHHKTQMAQSAAELTVRQQFRRHEKSVRYEPLELRDPVWLFEPGSLFVQCAWRDIGRLRQGYVKYNGCLWVVKQYGFTDGPHGNSYGLWAQLQ